MRWPIEIISIVLISIGHLFIVVLVFVVLFSRTHFESSSSIHILMIANQSNVQKKKHIPKHWIELVYQSQAIKMNWKMGFIDHRNETSLKKKKEKMTKKNKWNEEELALEAINSWSIKTKLIPDYYFNWNGCAARRDVPRQYGDSRCFCLFFFCFFHLKTKIPYKILHTAREPATKHQLLLRLCNFIAHHQIWMCDVMDKQVQYLADVLILLLLSFFVTEAAAILADNSALCWDLWNVNVV